MEIVLDKLSKHFEGHLAVDDLDLEVADGEFVALLGPSGCGKTTTLLTLAGIYRPTSGRVLFDGREVNRLPPRSRNLGMVFQSYALYPNMTVFDNIGFPLRLQKVRPEERRRRVVRIAEMMNIGELLERRPGQLSGGQQQRVALGRALVKEPDALLFDEPLSNLDAGLRLTMRTEIKRLQAELGITSIFVTHDQVEAMTMAKRVAIMRAGRLESYATPENTYNRPTTLFVASFVGNPPMNFLEARVSGLDGRFAAEAGGMAVPVSAERGRLAAEAEGAVVLGVRPEDFHLAPDGGGQGVRGEVLTVEPLGREDLVVVTSSAGEVRALLPAGSGLHMGDHVVLRVDPDRVQFFDPASGRSLLWD